MEDNTEEHGLIGKIGNSGNQFKNNVEPSLNIYFYKQINQTEPFADIIVIEKTAIYIQDRYMNSYELPPCYSKRKIYRTFLWNCGQIKQTKSYIKQPMVNKLPNIY